MSKKKDKSHSLTEDYIVLAISSWLEAIDEFLQWQDKLSKAIHNYHSSDCQSTNNVFSTNLKWSTEDLIRLHLDLASDLRNLLKNVNFIDDGLSSLTKIQELNFHTKTIHHWSKKIQKALWSASSGTA